MSTSVRVAKSTDAVPERVHAQLRNLVEGLASRRRLHHVNLAVASADGGAHWAGAAGPERGTGPAVDPEAPFFIASITKRFIAALVLQAHERGELDLDASVSACLPASVTTGLHVRGGVDRTPQITIRHLASHTSGLPDFFERRRGGTSLYRRLRAGQDTSWSFEDVVEITRTQQRPHFDPQDLAARSQLARYSDTGFQLLIRILEEATSTPFPTLIADRIASPLGLTRTWHPASEPPAGAAPALPLHAGRRPVAVDGVIASSNDLFSTTRDLLAFERALVAGTPFRDPATRHLLTERRNRLRNIPVLRYGLGTMTFSVNRLAAPGREPLTLVGHSGSTGTWLFTCPELGVHVAGTVDQTQAQSLPFRVMVRCLRIWAGGVGPS
ncbi:serine hydrolase domain-containing protein [Microbacterium album]|uniref:Serine hydrolase n=1 Tax=Microbacterium album TaxID=2053191 RepID=A0A917MLT6_9MICO|nr:serine hydrolase domain-containing protein [Microbacterium album]GGH44389.1 serine hydrolase [Microbacterium album]